ncbi:MAG: FMN-binding protein [Lachnospiraceae bacterium]|nr:FMN-binding protein [Lachnospiraceae bacterium]MBQ8117511.1 FMN-binding protein [Lachnospiraceae bacterium]
MKKRWIIALTCCTILVAATGCGGRPVYKDGTYRAQSETYTNGEDDSEAGNGYGVVEITIKDNRIVSCAFQTFELNGELKDEEYGKEGGKVANRDYYNKAQKAVAACDQYAAQLVERNDIRDIDAISGATINYNEFLDAAGAALQQAEQ